MGKSHLLFRRSGYFSKSCFEKVVIEKKVILLAAFNAVTWSVFSLFTNQNKVL
jgi:hypothetical protein